MSEIATFDGSGTPAGDSVVRAKISGLSATGALVFCTFDASTDEGKRRLYAATNDAEQLSDNLNKTLQLVDIVGVPATVNDDETGEVRELLRLVLLTKDGKRYSAISDGLYSSLQNIMAIFGSPAMWSEPLAIKVTESRSRRGFRFYRASLA